MAIYKQTDLDHIFRALNDSTRRAILQRLVKGEATVAEIGGPFKLSQPTISKHLKILEEAGLIEAGRDEQKRPRRLVPSAFKQLDQWVEPFKRQWERRFDNLEAHLSTMKRRSNRKSKS